MFLQHFFTLSNYLPCSITVNYYFLRYPLRLFGQRSSCSKDFFSFYWRYNPLWVLAFSVIFFHSALPLHKFLHLLISIICTSASMSSIHLFLGLPLFLLPIGFHSSTLLDILFLPSASRDPAKLFFCFLQIPLYLCSLLGRSVCDSFVVVRTKASKCDV